MQTPEGMAAAAAIATALGAGGEELT